MISREFPKRLRLIAIRFALVFVAFISSNCAFLPEAARTPAERYRQISAEFNEEMTRFSKRYLAASTDEQRARIIARDYPDPAPHAIRMFELAESAPEDRAAIDALSWILSKAQPPEVMDRVTELILTRYANDPRIEEVCARVGYTVKGEQFLRVLMESSPRQSVRANACFALAKQLMEKAQGSATFFGPEMIAWFKLENGEDFIEHLRSVEPQARLAEVERLFERLETDFASVEYFGGGTFGEAAQPYIEAAKANLRKIGDLAVGKPAPEIIGEDLDGVPFKLSDYRGKVIMLDFWGHW